MVTREDLRDVGKEFKQSPVAFVNNILKKKFTLAILIHIWFLKEHRFGELITIRSMNSKTLTLTLRNMAKSGLIRKKIITQTSSPKSTKYYITKKGKALLQVYMHMINFAMEYYSKDVLVDGKPKKIEQVLSKEILKIIQ
ncbi:MAG: winged helix-turn-helix transcriptional regulator [Nitrosopumilus sp.]|uniref:winged helix-turn-helix transcriptional regulator n=1 Tax=Nitrosopumilus sp. TaxID=2024843 RepID=UPI002930DE83|nr:winged helix-turn-helix transcriptional regulator [Nitrosopumilus sp.]